MITQNIIHALNNCPPQLAPAPPAAAHRTSYCQCSSRLPLLLLIAPVTVTDPPSHLMLLLLLLLAPAVVIAPRPGRPFLPLHYSSCRLLLVPAAAPLAAVLPSRLAPLARLCTAHRSRRECLARRGAAIIMILRLLSAAPGARCLVLPSRRLYCCICAARTLPRQHDYCALRPRALLATYLPLAFLKFARRPLASTRFQAAV